MKKLLYIANLRLPTEKAYGIQITKMCEAFAEKGVGVTLLIPTRNNPINKDIFDYYGLKRSFEVVKLFSPDFYLSGNFDKPAVVFKNILSSVILSSHALFNGADVIYSRDESSLYFLSFFKKNPVLEVHKFSSGYTRHYRRFKKTGIKIVAISGGIKDEFIKLGYSPEKILVAHDGVDLEHFTVKKSKEECRAALKLPQDKKIVLYSGHLYKWKGADTFLEATRNFQDDKDISFVFVGGTEPDIKEFKERTSATGSDNVIIVGHVPHNAVPLYLTAADVLVLPNSGKEDISRLYTSPLKMFEYMASGRPIIASDLPSLREVLNENNAVLVKPDNASALTDGIKKVLTDNNLAKEIAQKALENVKIYSWQERAKKIIEFVGINKNE